MEAERRGLCWLDGVSLDARLGVRMLVKHRWLTLVGGVAMAVAILPAAASIAWHVVRTELEGPPIPVDRVVVANMNLSDEARIGGSNFRTWRGSEATRLRWPRSGSAWDCSRRMKHGCLPDAPSMSATPPRPPWRS
jgi:hypothetical protein